MMGQDSHCRYDAEDKDVALGSIAQSFGYGDLACRWFWHSLIVGVTQIATKSLVC